MAVFVLDKHKQPLMPASEKRARLLLSRGRAVVVRRYPFTIRLKDRVGGDRQPLQIKLDPGSKSTGVALVRESEVISISTGEIAKHLHILNLFQLNHRGQAISDALKSRSGFRRRRRSKNLRYRKARFNNRTKKAGWLAPSLQHRVNSILRLVEKIRKLSPVTSSAQELVRFDMQQMENPEISGVEYQQGELAGFEVKEYLLLKWNHQCAYCDKKDIPLEVEHIIARINGGTNRVSNLTLACRCCNQSKGARSIEDFLKHQPARLAAIRKQAKASLKDAAAVNSTRWALFNALKATGLKVSTGSGGLTKFNRKQHGIPKTHALDAACDGQFDTITNWSLPALEIRCMGRGSYQRTRLTRYGFPRGYLMRQKYVHGFQTGDRVKATVTKGKKIGTYHGRAAVRFSGSFNITTAHGVIQGISYKAYTLIARNDGYDYSFQPKIAN
jgi:hypothetical protein